MRSVRSYQDIKTPEEEEEDFRRRLERQERALERAEYLAEVERDKEMLERYERDHREED